MWFPVIAWQSWFKNALPSICESLTVVIVHCICTGGNHLWHFVLETFLSTGRSRVSEKFSSGSQSKTSWPPLVYTILWKYAQNTHFIQITPCFRCSFHCFGMLQVRENEISLHNSSGGPAYLRTLNGTLLTMQCKWTFAKRFILSTLQRKCSMLR